MRKVFKGGNYSREEISFFLLGNKSIISVLIIQGRKIISKKASKGRKLFKGGNYIREDTIQGIWYPKDKLI